MTRREIFDTLMARTNQEGTFAVDNGMRIVTVADGEAVGFLAVDAGHLNRMGIVHGGVYMTMMDQAAGTAACSRGDRCRTVSCQVRFLDTAGEGARLYARGRAVRMGRSISVVDVRVETEEGTVCAEGTYTFRMKPPAASAPQEAD